MTTEQRVKNYVERELNNQFRYEVSRGIRRNCPKGDPIFTCIAVMLGSVLTMAALNAILNRNAGGRSR